MHGAAGDPGEPGLEVLLFLGGSGTVRVSGKVSRLERARERGGQVTRSVEQLERKGNGKALVKMLERDPDNYEAEKALIRIGDAETAEVLMKGIARHAKSYGEFQAKVQSKEEQAAQALAESTGRASVVGIGNDVAPAERKQAEDQRRHLLPLTRALSCIWSEDQIRGAMARPDLADKWVQAELETAAQAAVHNWSPRA